MSLTRLQQADQLEDAFSSSHRSLTRFGIGLGRILRRFGVFNISIESSRTLPYASFDDSPLSRIALVIYSHFDQIVSLLIHLDSSLHDFSRIVRSAFNHLSFSHTVSASSGYSQAGVLRSLDFSIIRELRRIQGHATAVLSLSLPDISGSHYAQDVHQHIGLQWDAFYGILLDLQEDFNRLFKSIEHLLPLARELIDRCTSVAAPLNPSFN